MLTKIKIFEILDRNLIIFENVKRNRDLRNFAAKPNPFSKMLNEVEIFLILNRNRIFFENVDLTEIENFQIWNEIEIFLFMLTEIEIFELLNWNRNFVENVDRNQDFPNFEPKSKFFRKYWPKSRFSKFLN